MRVRTGELFDHADGVLDTRDIERVHDMRVASRRLRAVLEIFAPCFPQGEFKGVLRDVKALADALGERRDPDVAIAGLERLRDELGAAERPGLESLIAELRVEQETANERLAEALRGLEASGLRGRLLALAAEARAA